MKMAHMVTQHTFNPGDADEQCSYLATGLYAEACLFLARFLAFFFSLAEPAVPEASRGAEGGAGWKLGLSLSRRCLP